MKHTVICVVTLQVYAATITTAKHPSPVDLVHISQNFFYVAESLLQNGYPFLASSPDGVLIRNLFQ